jgi:hypothetical protein
MAMSAAERARAYRRRRRDRRGTADVVLFGPANQAARTHGAWARDLDAAVTERLADPDLPDYIRLPVFAPAAAIALRRVERAARIGEWVASLPEAEQLTPRRAGSSAPAEVSRLMDDSALRALATLGLTPQSAARFARQLDQSGRPDLALLALEEGEDAVAVQR